MSGISTHILDLSRGRPAAGVGVVLSRQQGDGWAEIAARKTDADGRVKGFLPSEWAPEVAVYRLRFETGEYFRAQGEASFHPAIEITFEVRSAAEHYHVPLLVTPHSYSTYRGS